MPVPRRFDRSLPERDTTRVNERIRVPEVRLIGDDGEQVGILKTPEALRYAQERELDLVEVAPDAKPPVCRVLDYSKYKYEQAQRAKAARKHQQQITVREIKLRPKIAIGDYNTKKGHVERFLKARDKVKVTIMFRGREVTHPERGEMLLSRLADDLGELAIVEQRPQQDGRNMTMMLGPGKIPAQTAASADGTAPAAKADGTAPAAKADGTAPAAKADDTAPAAKADDTAPAPKADDTAPAAEADDAPPAAEAAEADGTAPGAKAAKAAPAKAAKAAKAAPEADGTAPDAA